MYFLSSNSNQVMDEMISARVKKVVTASILLLVVIISPLIIFLVRKVTVTIQVRNTRTIMFSDENK